MSELRSILLHLDSSERCAERIRVAAQVAEAFDASVSGVYSVVPSLLRYPLGLEASAGVPGLLEYDTECREKASRRFAGAAAASGRMRWEDVPGDAIASFERRALYADLLVLGQRDDDVPLSAETPPDFVARLIVESGHPALVVPFAGSFAAVGRTVLIAWKETREAARAVSAAMPWLRAAGSVHALSYGEDGDAALQALARYLAAHGVRITPHREPAGDVDVGSDLLSRAADIGADMLVMGCYGHSRAREWVLGGASRTVLRSMTVPVLMAH